MKFKGVNPTTLRTPMKPHPDFQGEQLVQNFSTYTRINIECNRVKSLMRLARRGLARPVLRSLSGDADLTSVVLQQQIVMAVFRSTRSTNYCPCFAASSV